MTDIVDLATYRQKQDTDSYCIRHDQDGREMLLFALEYELQSKTIATHIWAYSMEDAEKRVEAMRTSLVVIGRTVEIIHV